VAAGISRFRGWFTPAGSWLLGNGTFAIHAWERLIDRARPTAAQGNGEQKHEGSRQ
jgi:hypothetical protein